MRTDEPPARCVRHVEDPATHACAACRDAREYREEWLRNRATEDAEQRSADARAHADLLRRDISRCWLCGPDGYLVIGVGVCHHDPHAAQRTRDGMALVRAALAAQQTEPTEDNAHADQ